MRSLLTSLAVVGSLVVVLGCGSLSPETTAGNTHPPLPGGDLSSATSATAPVPHSDHLILAVVRAPERPGQDEDYLPYD